MAGELVLGPFQGKPACARIPFGKGVCGTAADNGETVLVPDVADFPGHIACDPASRSEIVAPLVNWGNVLGVLDVDSASLNRFDEDDREGIESIVAVFLSCQSTGNLARSQRRSGGRVARQSVPIDIHLRISRFHFGGNLAGRPNLNQFTFADARTNLTGLLPGFNILDQFRPERI